ncbi:hypothetical protein PsorP6_002078 [Peronosclerospora sorghi]|uniref:Uncharacterized protein n=1 Tax=Peronosclerospora sorghi TaxID=230839 RepID=A0ACC0WXN6_9STRA|nr:hypothetical protein PsorP6_002078 [Peronosclerospora sorghi]
MNYCIKIMRLVPLFLTLVCVCGEEYHRHTNNWAVIVDTSRFWNNYRHVANALSLYHSVKRLGIPDSQIKCHETLATSFQANRTQNINLLSYKLPLIFLRCTIFAFLNFMLLSRYGKNVEVDYRGSEVSVANFIAVLNGHHEHGTPVSKKIDTDENSNIFVRVSNQRARAVPIPYIYTCRDMVVTAFEISGSCQIRINEVHHGNADITHHDQDLEEMSSHYQADSIKEMHVKKRCGRIIYLVMKLLH